MIFFFQAEDGIRDLVRSRGLGDVYKRQPERIASAVVDMLHEADALIVTGGLGPTHDDITRAVSYTHLTLPTSDLV